MTYFSMFSGVEGFGLGLGDEWQPIGFSETDKYASQVLKYHYPNIQNYGDCTKINYEQIPNFDLLTGGSPCQDFSIAGKRRGLEGSRSSLAWEYIRALCSKHPRYFIWENVKGVLSSRGGFDFANILTAFSESGYALWWQVLNAKDFGVPQNRERIFVVGFREGSPKEVFFNKPEMDRFSDERGETEAGLREVALTLKARDFGNWNGNYIQQLNRPKHSQKSGRNTELGIAGASIRKLTPIECERLMSWPDNRTRWGINEKGEKIEISDSQRYKMCGNGVVSNVVREIAKVLLAPPTP